jgi:transcriptional regulator with XRE-family HTH domain
MARTSDKSAPDRVDVHVGKRIRARRRLCKISQVELANSIGLSFQQIQKYERGLNRVSASKLYAIAKHLGAPISHFFEGLEDEAEGDRGPRREQNVADAFRRMENQRLRRGCIDFVKLLAAETRSERLG